MFVGTNLTDIRILHGLTRKQLATMLNITEQAVWQYENGYVSPKMEMINKLKRIFNVKSKYFFQTDFLEKYKTNAIDHNHIAYRSSVINSVQKTQIEASHIDKLIAFLNFINENLQFPVNRIKELRNNIITWLDDGLRCRKDYISDIATYARKFLRVDEEGNQNLLFLLEKMGHLFLKSQLAIKLMPIVYGQRMTNHLLC